MKLLTVLLSFGALGTAIAYSPLNLVEVLTQPASSSPNVLAATTTSAFCRDERLRYSTQRWQMIQTLPTREALLQIQRELTQAQRLALLPLSVATVDRAIRQYPSRDRFAPNGSEITRDQAMRFWDSIAALAQTLPNSYASLKTQTLTDTALAYEQWEQTDRGLSALRSATQSALGIQGTIPALEAQTRLAEAWLTFDRPMDATASVRVAATAMERGLATQDIDRWMLRLVDLAARTQQPQIAQKILQGSAKAQPETQTQAQVKIAAAFARTQDLATARSLVDPLVQKALALATSEARDAMLLPLVLDYASSLDLVRLASWTNRLNQPAFRGRAWLAIAGEARKGGQTAMTTQALDRLVAEGQAANIRDMFSSRWDFVWGAEMESLAKQRGYEPELKAFSRQIKAPHRMSYVVNELIQQKRFDEAKELISKPLMVQVDVDLRDMSDELLDRIAIAAAKAGHFAQALDQAQAIQTDWNRLLPLAIALQIGGNRTEADQLFAKAEQAADSLSALSSHATAQAALAAALMDAGRSDAANTIIQKLVRLLQTEPDQTKQEQLLLSLGNQFGRQRQLQLQVAEKLNLLDAQPRFVQVLSDELLQLRDVKAAYYLISKPRNTPLASLEFVLNVAELAINQGEAGASLLDMPSISLSDGPSFLTMPGSQKANYYERIALLYLDAGVIGSARNSAEMIWNQQKEQRDRLLQRLSCY